MTKEEKHLWYDFLKGYPERFLRQKVIDDYIVTRRSCQSVIYASVKLVKAVFILFFVRCVKISTFHDSCILSFSRN